MKEDSTSVLKATEIQVMAATSRGRTHIAIRASQVCLQCFYFHFFMLAVVLATTKTLYSVHCGNRHDNLTSMKALSLTKEMMCPHTHPVSERSTIQFAALEPPVEGLPHTVLKVSTYPENPTRRNSSSCDSSPPHHKRVLPLQPGMLTVVFPSYGVLLPYPSAELNHI